MGISWDRTKLLGIGGFACVFKGTLRSEKCNIPVAVKRIQLPHVNKREEDALRHLQHPNVITFLKAVSDLNFR